MPAAVCLGEALIDFVADVSGVTIEECPGFRKAPGGAPANVAVGLCRLGVEAAFLGKVGDDPFGRFLAASFAEAGVDTQYMRFDPDARTGLAFVSLRADGERDFVFYRSPSADMLYRADEIPDAALEGCRVFHFGSITLIQEPSRSATLDALRRARERGALISYDPNLRPPLWPDLIDAKRGILAAMPLADVVKLSEEEVEFLFGAGSVERLAAAVLACGPSLAAITRGPGGSYLATRSARIHVPGYAIEAVDTTGAGDGFAAGILAMLLESPGIGSQGSWEGLEEGRLRQLGQFANAVGALTCRNKGAIPSLPPRAAVDRFLAKR